MNKSLHLSPDDQQRLHVSDLAESLLDDGSLFATLQRRVAHRTESTRRGARETLLGYLEVEMLPELQAMGFVCDILPGLESGNPMLIARRIEADGLPTIFGYGHGDVVSGAPHTWSAGLDPWTLVERDGAWYGRGIVDNKGQHTINLAAMRTVLQVRGRLGFNAVWLFEMGEEIGSPGLREVCREEGERLAADVLIASDGPRVSAARPTLYLGTRGAVNFTLSLHHRETGHHSGNWGGLLANPAIQLAHAIAAIASVSGQIKVPGWTPGQIPESVRVALSSIEVNSGPKGPAIAQCWGEPGLSAAEQLYGWSSFDVLALDCGDAQHPVNAVPPTARAHCQLRTVVGVDELQAIDRLRSHLDAAGLSMVQIENVDVGFMATRLDPSDPWVRWVGDSLSRTTGKSTAVLPNVGGSLPNDAFSEQLGMRTIWIPHSYPGAQNHGGNEHMPVAVAREALRLMAALYWDLGDAAKGPPSLRWTQACPVDFLVDFASKRVPL